MKFLLATKQGMTQLFTEEGSVVPVTVLSVPPQTVTQVKNKDTDGYTAVQLGHGTQKEHRVNKAQKAKGNFKGFKEFRVDDKALESMPVGTMLTTEVFADGDAVSVSGVTKGRGFQGVVKRHGFHGGPRSHGQKHSEREPGSIGGGPGRAGGRVVRGLRMGGRMGSERVTENGHTIARIDSENNLIYVTGAVPGRKGTLIEIVQN